MKTWIITGLCLLLCVSLAGCGEKDRTPKTYTAQAAKANHGYKDTLQLTFSGETVTEAEFESYDEEGKRKSEAKDYPMSPPPSEWIPELSEHVKQAKTPQQIETVAGASISSANARQLYAAIVQARKEEKNPAELIAVDLKPADK